MKQKTVIKKAKIEIDCLLKITKDRIIIELPKSFSKIVVR